MDYSNDPVYISSNQNVFSPCHPLFSPNIDYDESPQQNGIRQSEQQSQGSSNLTLLDRGYSDPMGYGSDDDDEYIPQGVLLDGTLPLPEIFDPSSTNQLPVFPSPPHGNQPTEIHTSWANQNQALPYHEKQLQGVQQVVGINNSALSGPSYNQTQMHRQCCLPNCETSLSNFLPPNFIQNPANPIHEPQNQTSVTPEMKMFTLTNSTNQNHTQQFQKASSFEGWQTPPSKNNLNQNQKNDGRTNSFSFSQRRASSLETYHSGPSSSKKYKMNPISNTTNNDDLNFSSQKISQIQMQQQEQPQINHAASNLQFIQSRSTSLPSTSSTRDVYIPNNPIMMEQKMLAKKREANRDSARKYREKIKNTIIRLENEVAELKEENRQKDQQIQCMRLSLLPNDRNLDSHFA